MYFQNFGHVQFPPQQTSRRHASPLFVKCGHIPISTKTDMQILFFLAGGLVQFPLQQLWKFPCRDPCPSTPILQFTSSRIRACPNSVTTVVAIRPFRILDTVNSTFEQTWTFTFSEKRTRPMSPTRIWKFALSEFRPSKQSRTFSFFDNQTGSSPPRTDLKIQFL